MRLIDRLIPFLIVVTAALAAFALFMDVTHTPPLPHRPVTDLTNWGQGRAPDQNRCPPGTIRFETDSGIFLECYRPTN